MHHWCFHWNYHELDRYEKTKWCWSSPYEEEQWLLFCWRVAAPPDNPQIVPVPTPSSSSQSRSWSQWCLQLDKDSCCCAVNKERLVRTQKHYPAPLAIPLPNYSYDGKELERQVKLKKSGTQVKSRRNILEAAAGELFSTYIPCPQPILSPQASARFGTIPRVTKLHEAAAHSHDKGEHENRYRWPASEGTRYLGFQRF